MAAPAPRYAYVALLMKGNGYLPGLKALSASLRATRTPYDFVLMVTPDVDVAQVQPYVTSVVQVPYLTYDTRPMKTTKQRAMYERWMDSGYTKWNALNLIQYSKVLLLDLDVILLENLDHLFELPTPAATFSNAWAQPYTANGMINPYLATVHGKPVLPAAIRKGLQESFVLIGTTVLLEPSAEVFTAFQEFVKTRQPYGNKDCYSAMDEQSLSEFYLERGTTFYHISQRYNIIPWHAKKWLLRGEKAAVYHFFGAKPWTLKRNEWPDLAVWWRFHDTA